MYMSARAITSTMIGRYSTLVSLAIGGVYYIYDSWVGVTGWDVATICYLDV